MTEDELVAHALVWALNNVGDEAPRSSISGWTPNDVTAWKENKAAVIDILMMYPVRALPDVGEPALALAEFLEQKPPRPACEICQQPGHVCPECPWSDAGNGEPILG